MSTFRSDGTVRWILANALSWCLVLFYLPHFVLACFRVYMATIVLMPDIDPRAMHAGMRRYAFHYTRRLARRAARWAGYAVPPFDC